jgi:hypothetical protein
MIRIARHAVALVAAIPITAATFNETLAAPGTQSRPTAVAALV